MHTVPLQGSESGAPRKAACGESVPSDAQRHGDGGVPHCAGRALLSQLPGRPFLPELFSASQSCPPGRGSHLSRSRKRRFPRACSARKRAKCFSDTETPSAPRRRRARGPQGHSTTKDVGTDAPAPLPAQQPPAVPAGGRFGLLSRGLRSGEPDWGVGEQPAIRTGRPAASTSEDSLTST